MRVVVAALLLLALGATATHAQVATDDDAAPPAPAPHISTGGIPDSNRISAPADEGYNEALDEGSGARRSCSRPFLARTQAAQWIANGSGLPQPATGSAGRDPLAVRPGLAHRGEQIEPAGDDAASPVPADEVSAEADEPSPIIGALWCPVLSSPPPASDDADTSAEPEVRCSLGAGIALYHWRTERWWWRAVPVAAMGAALDGKGYGSVGVGVAWVVTDRGARRPVAVAVGVAAPWDDGGVYWQRREVVIGVTRSLGGGGE